MRFFKVILAVIIALNLSSCKDDDATNNELEKSKQELLKTISEFNKAFRNGNVSVLESMITENYLHTNGNSKSIGKKSWLNYLSKRENEINSGNLDVIRYEMDEIKIEFYRNMAIVTGKVAVSNKKKEEIQKNEYRITNVWVNEDGNWKRAAFHDGKIK
ncbi:nuclear transport factor 2 family protein [uncultured Aquimarina sp.]|uniref:nuclear transport factor 2 family protein n=1 Tax=uncultured Aquimarina sp. TaxID=575652 RepID=UPI00261F8FF9|nr:nuclear transport factor 2 family protein [uncultured Aquimarina sp.]